MNIFNSSAPSVVEEQRQTAIKEQITDNLRQALKVLQRTHISSDQPIQSEDAANAVCSVLEAVFLHGLKGSVTKKNFWGLLQKTTHKNTVAQLTALSQITTDVGLCRAWLRVALNEGVLESYLNAILADTKTLRYYYTRTSYLRDPEHPGILLTYIQGLSHFFFQLSYNSSVLNIWSHTPLLLAGLVAPLAEPHAVIASVPVLAVSTHSLLQSAGQQSAVPQSGDIKKKIKYKHPSIARTNARTISTIGYADQGASMPRHPATPPNTPYDPSQLTASDIDAIRGLSSRAAASSDDTSSTNTSQISQPDPVDARVLQANLPEVILAMGRGGPIQGRSKHVLKPEVAANVGQPSGGTESPLSRQRSSKVSKMSSEVPGRHELYDKHLNPFEEEIYGNPFDQSNDESSNPFLSVTDSREHPRVDRRSKLPDTGDQTPSHADDRLVTGLASSHNHISAQEPRVTSEQQVTPEMDSAIVNKLNASNVSFSVGDPNYSSKPPMEEDQNEAPSIYASDPSHISASETGRAGSNTSQEATSQSVSTISWDVSESTMSWAASESPHNSLTSSQQSSVAAALNKSSSFPKLDLGKSPPLEPEMSTAMATCDRVEVAKEALLGVSSSTDLSSAIIEEADEEVYPTGNSLTNRDGWSSSFETSQHSPWPQSPFQVSDLHGPMITSVNESFGNMLDNYGSSVGRLEAATMSEVLDGLPDSHDLEDTSHSLLQRTSSPQLSNLQQVPTLGEEVMEEYEVLPDLVEKRVYLTEPKYQPLLDVIGTVCTEKGLDMQNYQCKSCSRPVGMFYGKARVCGYDACYYCYECHENDEAYIPARIIFNWDFRKQKVCRQSLEFLQQSEDDPLLDVQSLNPRLYQHVNEIAEIKRVRTQLRFLKAYLFTCKQSIADELRKQIWPREYYYDDIDAYSLSDLLQVAAGQLVLTISKVVKFASKHVYDCGLCSQKGFICEICNNAKVIYPFEMDVTEQCPKCKTLYHKDCKRKLAKCPKCKRRQERRMRLGSDSDSTSDCCHDYAISPDNQTITAP